LSGTSISRASNVFSRIERMGFGFFIIRVGIARLRFKSPVIL
jgi:hypothetical protein